MLFGHTVVLASVLVATFASSEHQDDNDENRRSKLLGIELFAQELLRIPKADQRHD